MALINQNLTGSVPAMLPFLGDDVADLQLKNEAASKLPLARFFVSKLIGVEVGRLLVGR
jgi:hypothetical protein